VRNDEFARGIERLAAQLARIKALEPQAFTQLARLLGAANMAELARDLPWYVLATAFPGPVLAATLQRSPERFETLSARLVAYREFMRKLDDGLRPYEIYFHIRDWQRQRLLDEVYWRYPEGDDDDDDDLTLTIEHQVVHRGCIDVQALEYEFGRFLDLLYVPREQVKLDFQLRPSRDDYYLDFEFPAIGPDDDDDNDDGYNDIS
jgi:hypothetical protein